jgi:hypothetical protein
MEHMIIFCARGGGEFLIGLIFIAIVALISLIAGANNQKWVVVRNGLPYCPNCNRQVSLKAARPCCRACGFDLTKPPASVQAAREKAEKEARAATQLAEEAARKERVKKEREREELA